MLNIAQLNKKTEQEVIEDSILTNTGDTQKYVTLDSSNKMGYINKADITAGTLYKDIIGHMYIDTTKVTNNPTFTNVGNFWFYKFALNDEGYAHFHVNHDYKPSGNIFIHIHYFTDGTNLNSVKWDFKYTMAKGHNQSSGGTFNFSTPSLVSVDSGALSGVPYRHYISEISATIDNTNAEPDSICSVHFKRVTNGATDNTDGVYVLVCDLHVEIDRQGTINKAPNFYA